VRLWLSLIAYNLGNLWRRLVLPTKIDNWSLTSLQQRLVKTGGRLVKHAQYYWLKVVGSEFGAEMRQGRSGVGEVVENEPVLGFRSPNIGGDWT